ncbi:unnamed protein product [Aspergillus oryzae]|uniref:Unnamed protein product n=1 Tax=Aspergillus oryzae var. brunneus TaxID=332754 RepID=A0ABQ6KC51_ASPOZ|nr:unnamed protein product [Aspergillus oryzae]GMF86363.1 unnamed protein product [Aspergillus oryzae]GMG02652.1 unnamed protein product [Aspergillus oryzae]GMG40982.1 unnamed protein product [Aspergillus oryzae var. brunneus]
MKTYNIASIPADGIGPEVISAGVTVLNALAEKLNTFKLDFTHYDWSSETYKTTGKYIPDGGLEDLKRHDAILFGAVGAPGKYSEIHRRRVRDRPSPHMQYDIVQLVCHDDY